MDLKLVRVLHVLTLPSCFPRDFLDGVAENRIRHHSQALAKALGGVGGHHLQYLFIESYDSETAVLDDDLAFGLRPQNEVKPLRAIRGIGLVWIRAMKVELVSYLRTLEKEMMSRCTASPDLQS